ncbi:hypothetical protein [Parathermosynechococcus lividus]
MKEQVYYNSQMPLAVYREMAAHLGLLEGVEVRLLPPTSPQFDYSLSQVAGVALGVPESLPPTLVRQLEHILQHYGDRYGGWQTVSSS